MNEETLNLQKALVEALLDKRALDVVSMDVADVTPLADSFVLASGNSDVHMNALVNAVTDCLDQHHEAYKVEGAMSSQWTLIDAGNIVVHIFSVKAREYYKVERIWGDAKITRYESHD
ncbi:MAG: ribosome silencing factor [Pyramidobacter sp.]|jgi:ribosome-associated protein|nr:ribosome silencing factor [Synergistaceae bacterium]MBP3836263.1 ribosome silencing factor [Pyramidobacter sp.]MBP3848608.1 ribosome silencing factor [Pyramidobacter sp.]